MFSSDGQFAAKYKIVCFKELPETKQIGICDYCVCVDAKEQQVNKENFNGNIQQTIETNKCIFNGKPVDLHELSINISKRIDELKLEGFNGGVIELLNDAYREICKCNDGICQSKDKIYECDWVKKCRDNGVKIPIQQG